MISRKTYQVGLVLGILLIVAYITFAMYWMNQDMGWGIFALLTYQGVAMLFTLIIGIMLIVFSRKGLQQSSKKGEVLDDKK